MDDKMNEDKNYEYVSRNNDISPTSEDGGQGACVFLVFIF